jgi:hypothetical protein
MSNEANLDELARRYLELWQDQMSALAADPEFAEALSRLVNTMGLTGTQGGGFPGLAASAWSAWPAMLSGMAAAMEGQAEDGASLGRPGSVANAGPKTTARSATAAAASEPGAARLAELESRLAALQDRVAALERRSRRSRPRPARRSGRERD